jgi:hypothetical protein
VSVAPVARCGRRHTLRPRASTRGRAERHCSGACPQQAHHPRPRPPPSWEGRSMAHALDLERANAARDRYAQIPSAAGSSPGHNGWVTSRGAIDLQGDTRRQRVGCATRMGPLSCRFAGRVLGMVAPLPPRLGGHPGALKARLPHAVPLDPAARTPGPRRCRQGPGAPGAAPPAQRPAPPSPTAQARARRPCPAGCDQPRAAPIALVLLPCQAGDAAALAPSPGRRRGDVSSRTRATAAG